MSGRRPTSVMLHAGSTVLAVILVMLLVAACSPDGAGGAPGGGPSGRRGGSGAASAPSAPQATSAASPFATSGALAALNLSAQPLGDNHTTTSGPRADYLYVCTTTPFSRGGGAEGNVPWIHANGTYDLSAKAHVDGSVSWPAHSLSITIAGDTRVIHTNDLPSVPTGIYPIQSGTTAFQYDRNPNSIQPQDITLNLPASPSPAASPSCLAPGGTIGVMLDGVTLFNGVDAGGRDAVAHEVQDACWGHPEMRGDYHYHSLTPCMDIGSLNGGTSPLLGYALDGYGIYGPFQGGKLLTNADLDACHGTTSAVQWDGQTVSIYHYVANFEFPYTVGCYHGTPAQSGSHP